MKFAMQSGNLFNEIIRDYRDNRYCDLDLCGGQDGIQKITPIRCHKLVLCSFIPDWLEMVDEDTDCIAVPDVEHSQLKCLIDGLYAQLAKKCNSWEQFDPELLAFLGVRQKWRRKSRRPKPRPSSIRVTEASSEDEQIIALDGIKVECDVNPEESDSDIILDLLTPKEDQLDPLDIVEYLAGEDLTAGLFEETKRKRKPSKKTTDQVRKKVKLGEKNTRSKKSLSESTLSNSISSPSTDTKRLSVLKKNQKNLDGTQQTRAIDFNGLQNKLKVNEPGQVHVNVTTPNIKAGSGILKSLTSTQDSFFALVGIQRRDSEILGRTLAFTTESVDAVNASFLSTMEAYMTVFGFAPAPLMSANSFYTLMGSKKKNKGPFINDLHRRFHYQSTRKDLEGELKNPDVVKGFLTSPPTHKDILLPLESYDICLTNDALDYEDIIIVGVHKHGVEARQLEIQDISQKFVPHFCSRVLILIWGGGNGQAAFPPSTEIQAINRTNTRINYTFETIKKLLASDEELPRPLPILTCEICGKQIQENAYMNKMVLHKKGHMIEQFKCDCDIHFTTLSQKKQHYEEWHTKKSTEKFGKPKAKDLLESSSLPSHVCDVCGKVVGSKIALWQHNHEAHRNITCQSCDQYFGTTEAFKKHWREAHPEQDFKAPSNLFRCSECSEIFLEKIELSNHWIQAHGSEDIRPFKCGLCPKSFVGKPKLKYHALNVHIKSRPYKCRKEGCSSTFNYCGNLYAHEKKVHGARLGTAIPLDNVVKDSQLLEMGCQLKPPTGLKSIAF